MTTKIKLKRGLVVSDDFLSGIRKLGKLPFDFKTGYALARTLRQVEAEAEAFQAAKISAIKKYGTQVGETSNWELKPDNKEAYNAFLAEIQEYASKEFEIYLDHSLSLPENANLLPAEIAALIDLIEPPVTDAILVEDPAKI